LDSLDRKFINAGLWVSCVLFLTVALLAGVLAALFAVVNTTTNPVEPIAGVFGLYVWNGAAGNLSDSMALKLFHLSSHAKF
jgi:ABC-type amino acid transport system permease subunit